MHIHMYIMFWTISCCVIIMLKKEQHKNAKHKPDQWVWLAQTQGLNTQR